ncbi:MAG: hypothetical protein WA771_06175 [Chthoniobacterales bacterium]
MICGSRADINLPSPPPPQPVAQSVTVYEGESVDIPLSGVSRTGLQLRFLIRSQPSLGGLSTVRKVDRSNGVITYTHDPARGVGPDSFRYAVQVPRSGVSTPAEVSVSVVERPPAFEAPARLEFPDVEIGGAAVEILELANSGGGSLSGRVEVPKPWSLPTGNGSYLLAPGEVARIAIRFEPTAPRNVEGSATFSHDPVRKLGLSGRGFTPIETAPNRVELRAEEDREVRAGILIVRNVSDEERELTIEAPREVLVQESVIVGPGAETEVALQTRAGFLGALDTSLTLRSGRLELVVPMTVFASPAKLVVNPAGPFDLGSPKAGESVRRKITVRNDGGSAAEIAAVVSGAVRVSPDPALQTIPAGGAREYELTFSRTLPGPIAEEVVLRGGISSVRLNLTGEVVSVLPSPGSRGIASIGADGVSRQTRSSIPPVEEIGVSRLTKTEMDLVWDVPSGEIDRFDLYQRKITFGRDGVARLVWKPLQEVEIERGAETASTKLVGLHAGERVTLSLVAVTASGEESPASPPFEIATRPPGSWRIPWSLVGIMVFAGCVYLIIRERLRVRREFAEQDAAAERRMHI